jgi:hypothetical protein
VSEWPEPEREATFLKQLELRRAELTTAQWQAPGLTIAAQAFLLQVITNDQIDPYARAWILAAGVVATFAALIALLRLRQREVYYSDAIAHYGGLVGVSDPRPFDLTGKRRDLGWQRGWVMPDRFLRWFSKWRWWPGIHHWWLAALGLFIAADVIAFLWTNEPPPVRR